jgi:hypothetical protein
MFGTILYTFVLWLVLITSLSTWSQWDNFVTLFQTNLPLTDILWLFVLTGTQPLFIDPLAGFHIVLTTGLFALYCVLFSKRVRQINTQMMASSVATSTLSLLGFSLGVTCISCGVVGMSLLLSGLGASTTTLLFFEQHQLWWITSEIALLVSIFLVTRAGNILSYKR